MLAREFGRELQVTTIGIDRLATEQVQLQLQGPSACGLLADVGHVDFSEPRPGQVVFRASR